MMIDICDKIWYYAKNMWMMGMHDFVMLYDDLANASSYLNICH